MTAVTIPAAPEDAPPILMDRKTKSGRSLQYRLTVLQQPERARACGSGSKSAADRRPVDPPPVVELRIFELGAGQEAKDITFHYNANFFLFATLELARPIAHGRVQTPAATGTPVLTGMPVSGMAYLDRPSEAGYFLFPDLSVRHEGRYKLSFNLYEETKEEKDFDEESSEPKHSPIGASFDWRMEIKSVAFSVYSAKKFPGLSESTALSRTVAEQGCRVRIRRDVRMRRRDGKPSGGDYKKAEDEYVHRPSARTPERQQPHDHRQRSLSAASDHSRIAYSQDPQRRPSMGESYPAPPPPPPPGYSQSASGSHHLGFGSAGPHSQQFPSAQPPPVSPTTAYPPSTHPSSPYQTPQSQPYGYSSRPSSQAYGSTKSGFDERRMSNTSYVAPSPQYPPGVVSNGEEKIEVDPRIDRRASQSYTPAALVPPSPARPEAKANELRLPSLTELMAPMTDKLRPIEVDPNPDPVQPAYSMIPTGSKRRYEEPAYSQQRHHGQRPRYEDGNAARPKYEDAGVYRRYPRGLSFIDVNGHERLCQENAYLKTGALHERP